MDSCWDCELHFINAVGVSYNFGNFMGNMIVFSICEECMDVRVACYDSPADYVVSDTNIEDSVGAWTQQTV